MADQTIPGAEPNPVVPESMTSTSGSATSSAVLDLARISSLLIELNQLDRYWRDTVGSLKQGDHSQTLASVRPVLDRMDQLLREFQTLTMRIVATGTQQSDAVRGNLTAFMTENRAIGLGTGNDFTLVGTAMQKQLLAAADNRNGGDGQPVDFDAAAAEAAAALAAAAEAERQRLEAEAAQLAAGGGGGGDSGTVAGIASFIVESGLSTGPTGSAGGGHPFTVLGCLAGVAFGNPALGCAGGFALDMIVKAQEEEEHPGQENPIQ